MSDSYRFAPFSTSFRPALIYGAALGAIAAFKLPAGGTLLPILPIQSSWHLLFWLMIAVSPIVALSFGWTYELTTDHFVAHRFGTERVRIPLREYKGRDAVLGYPRLRFVSRSVVLPSNGGGEWVAFFEELDRRSVGYGAATSAPTIHGDAVTIRIAHLRFPGCCVQCQRPASNHTSIRALYGFDLVVSRFQRFVDIEIPTCAFHSTAHARAKYLAYGGVWLATFVVTGVAIVVRSSSDGAPVFASILGVGLGLVGMRLAQALGLSRRVDFRTLGISALGLSADSASVRLRVRNASLRDELARTPLGEALVAVFA